MGLIRTELADMDFDRIHPWLSTDAYWAMGRTRDNVETAARHSLNFVEHLAPMGLSRVLLATRDAYEVYARVGFTPLPDPEIFMIRS